MSETYQRKTRYTDDREAGDGGEDYVVERVGVPPASSAYPWGAYYVLGFLCFFIVLIILAVFLFSYWGWGTTQNQAAIQSLSRRLAAQHHSDFETEGIYSLAHTLDTLQPQTLALCHMGLYTAAITGGGGAAATPTGGVALRAVEDTTAHITEKRPDNFYYVMKTRFAMHFNVDATRAAAYGFDLSRLNRAGDERYEIIHYEVASSYTDFSTIKLVESALDVSKRTLKVKREFIACSNNPLLSVKRCSNLVDGRLVMNNTRLEPMDATGKSRKDKKNKTVDTGPATTTTTTTTTTTSTTKVANKAPAVGSGDDDDEGIDLVPESQESLRALRQEISHVRLYHVVCYKNDALNRDDDTFRESLLLRIELNKC